MDSLKFKLYDLNDIQSYQTYEKERETNEKIRVENESVRISNEQFRINGENLRIDAEYARGQNEMERQKYFDEIQEKVSSGEFDGRGIVNTEKISTNLNVDTYQINYTDGQNPDTFTVTNAYGSIPGDMMKSVYDANDDGVVDNTEKLNNKSGDYYLDYNNFLNVPTNISEFNNDSNYVAKIDADKTYATKENAKYISGNTITINTTINDNKILSEVNDNSISEIKLSEELKNKLNGKQDSAVALFFKSEEEWEEN